MLEPSQIFAYVSALGVAAVIPGPGMTALIAHSVRGGSITGFSMLAGLIIGDLLYLSFAVFGLTMMLQNFDGFFKVVSLSSAIYLFYLSIHFWRYNPESIEVNNKNCSSGLLSVFASGLSITLGNPKTIAFYLAILPLVIKLDVVSVHAWGFVLVPLTIVVLLSVGGAFILGAMKVRYLLTKPQAQRYLFKSAGLIMFIAAVTMIIKAL
jgi:threonine/homoserine/homoserine lactone efflux protein